MKRIASRIPLLVALLALVALVVYTYSGNADWGEPLGPRYTGPEVKPRSITPPPSRLGTDELETIGVFETTTKSVVFVTNKAIRRSFFSLNLFEVPQGSGSGFVWNQQGHIVTNFHVIYGADAIGVVLADQSAFDARVVGVDPDHDLAVLQIQAPAKNLTPVEVGTSHDLRVGQKVLAIGNPFGLDHTLTAGVVSALGRTIKAMTDRTIEGVIQTDAAINPGNSGGPLLDSAGRLIGINTQIISPTGAFAGIGFAVPVDTINRIVPQLIKYGKVIRPGIGVSIIPDAIAARWGVRGLIIARVARGGPADRAGLQGVRETVAGRIELGDVITKVDGKPVRVFDDLLRILDRHRVGNRIRLEVVRERKTRQVTVTLQAID